MGWRGHPAACATALCAPSAPTTAPTETRSLADLSLRSKVSSIPLRVRPERGKAPAEIEARAMRLGVFGKFVDQPRALDDQVGAIQGDRGRAPVGEELESAEFR